MSAKGDYRVGVAIHSYGHINPTIYANHIGIFAAWAKTCNVKLLHVDGVKTAGARNMLVKKAIEEDCTHILFIDADHMVNVDMLPCLLGNMEKADVVSGLVVKKDGEGQQVGFLERHDGKFFQIALPSDGLSYEVCRCAFGCTLINLDVFKDIEKPYFKDLIRRDSEGKLQQHRSDMEFCKEVIKNGGKIRIDTRVKIGHLGDPKIYYPEDIQYQLHTYKIAADVAKTLALEGDSLSCVDFGCGFGRKLVDLIEPVCPKVVGLDVQMRVDSCIHRYPESQIEWKVADFNEPIKSLGTFDIAICADVLEHLREPKKLIADILKHLKPDGYVIISTPDVDTISKDVKNVSVNSQHQQFWNEKEFVALLKDSGLEVGAVKRVEEITNYISMVAVCRKLGNDSKSSN